MSESNGAADKVRKHRTPRTMAERLQETCNIAERALEKLWAREKRLAVELESVREQCRLAARELEQAKRAVLPPEPGPPEPSTLTEVSS